MNEVLAWLAFPALAVLVCLGVGLLAEWIARVELPPALVAPLGFAGAIVLCGPLYAFGAGAVPVLVVLLAAAAAGLIAARRSLRRFRPGGGALAAGAIYALYIAPVALTGEATFLGYNLLNDTAIHLALVDWLSENGARFQAIPASSYAAAIDEYVGSSYPMGSHELLAALRPAVGLDPALLYQPFIALAAGLAAAAVWAIARGEGGGWRAGVVVAVAALASNLLFAFGLQGGIKEVTLVTCLAVAAALARPLAAAPVRAAGLIALPAVALYAIYGVYALPWIAPLALGAALIARPALGRAVVVGAGVFLAGAAVHIPGSIGYFRHGSGVITSADELGPLGGPLSPLQAAGIWLRGDYRFEPETAWPTWLLLTAAALLAAVGVAAAVRRRSAGPLLFALPSLAATLVVAPVSSPYIDAKLFAVLSPAVVLMWCLGIARLPRVAAIASTVVLGGALFVSNALAYRMALPAPMERLDELAAIDERFAGRGPLLVNEFEEYVKHFARDSRGSAPYEKWTAGRAQLRDRNLPVAGRAYDIDQLELDFVQRWPLIALRRSPAGSRPPANYRRAFSGRYYEVWERDGPVPLVHVPLGGGLSPVAPLPCRTVARLRGRGAVIGLRSEQAPVRFDIARTRPLPPGFYVDPAFPQRVEARKAGTLAAVARTGAGTHRFWVEGTATRRSELFVDGRRVGPVRGVNGPGQWIEVGVARLAAGPHRVEIRRPKRSLRPGDARPDFIGPVLAVPETNGSLIRAERRCGERFDWVEAVRPGALPALPRR